MLKIRKDDTVVVLTGRDKGKSGKVIKVMPKDDLVVVQGVNVAKRHMRGRPGQPGGIAAFGQRLCGDTIGVLGLHQHPVMLLHASVLNHDLGCRPGGDCHCRRLKFERVECVDGRATCAWARITITTTS